jgi:hypothetical protein
LSRAEKTNSSSSPHPASLVFELSDDTNDDDFSNSASASEDEEDMLDLAFGLTHTSRLGCQIIITEELDGITVRLPEGTRNMQLD